MVLSTPNKSSSLCRVSRSPPPSGNPSSARTCAPSAESPRLNVDLLHYALTREPTVSEAVGSRAGFHMVVTCLDQMKEFSYLREGVVHTQPTMKDFLGKLDEHLHLNGQVFASTAEGDAPIKRYSTL